LVLKIGEILDFIIPEVTLMEDETYLMVKRDYWFLQGGKMKKDLDCIILTRQELQIMKVVWRLGEATVREVCEAISQKKPTAYTTILTLMGILEEKGALIHSRSGRAYVYKPLLSRRQATRNQIDDILERFFEGNPEKLLKYIMHNSIGSEPQCHESGKGNLRQSMRENQVA
jgi:BlaI family transcriptional regulator, penicillinase repressor